MIRHKFGAFMLCTVVCFGLGQAKADTIEIFFSGIDIDYDGTDITNKDPNGVDPVDPDPLINVSFSQNGVSLGTLSTDVFAELLIDDVAVVENTTVTSSGAGSFLRLLFPDESGTVSTDVDTDQDYLLLEMDSAMVTYIGGTARFVFAASVADAVSTSGSFPFDLADFLEAPLTLSFSTQVSSSTSGAAGAITSFAANGTGEVRGEFDPNQQNIPEPSTIGLALLASMMGGAVAMRKRLG